MSFDELWSTLLPIGRHGPTGGYRRYTWGEADRACRQWFCATAAARDMPCEEDRNGNLWAWWGEPGEGSVVTGSHLDSVPDGGAYDGPLGVVSAFAAVDALRTRGFSPMRSIAVAAFAEEEGARFGIACLGSRLLTGALDPARARSLADDDGVTLAQAMRAAGRDPDRLGRDEPLLRRIACYVELHVEQGRALVDLDAPVGVGSAIWPHGRWRMDFTGRADHAGTTLMADRADPMLTFATAVLSANKQARLHDARATVGRVRVEPGGTNAIPSRVVGWLDARAAEESTVDSLVASIERQATERARRDGTTAVFTAESTSREVAFDVDLRDRIAALLGSGDVLPGSGHVLPGSGPVLQGTVPVLATGAGHDAGVLAADVPTAMLFVRNPTGVSHAPAEHASRADCLVGVDALATVLEELAG